MEMPGLVYERAGTYSRRDALAVGCWNSDAQDALHRHRVTAIAPILEEAAGTIPFTVIECRGVYVILTMELCLKTSELDTLRLFRVAFGFCDFADHARIHALYSPCFNPHPAWWLDATAHVLNVIYACSA